MKNYTIKPVTIFFTSLLFACSGGSSTEEETKNEALFMEVNVEGLELASEFADEEGSSISSFHFQPDMLRQGDTLKAKVLNSFIELYVSKSFQDEKGTFWSGRSPEFQGSNFTVFEYQETYTANFNLDSIQYEITGQKGNFKIRKIDQDDFIEEDEPLFDEYDSTKNLIDVLDDELDDEGPSQIDILVCYTSFTKNSFGINGVLSRIGLAIQQTNLSFENSKVEIEAKLAGTLEVSYEETSSSASDVAWAQQDEQIQRVRDSLKADLVVLLTHSGSYAGRVYAIMNQLSTDFAPNAFAVVDIIRSTRQYSFTHELGHLMGCRHNCEKDTTLLPFSYSHGFANCSNTSFRTIMSYFYRCRQPRVLYWSNPDVEIDGIKTGTDIGSCAANCAFTLDQTRYFVSKFMEKQEASLTAGL